METSKNIRAEAVVGLRETGGTALDFPCEYNYHCPVCVYEFPTDGNYDERLDWSEYETFLWCSVCDKDYPTVLCSTGSIDEKIKLYLDCVETIKSLQETTNPQN